MVCAAIVKKHVMKCSWPRIPLLLTRRKLIRKKEKENRNHVNDDVNGYAVNFSLSFVVSPSLSYHMFLSFFYEVITPVLYIFVLKLKYDNNMIARLSITFTKHSFHKLVAPYKLNFILSYNYNLINEI